MKKIIILIAVFLGAACGLNAQNSAALPGSNPSDAKKSNAPKEAMINGIPYSQYKAQQQALKNSQQTNAASPSLTVQPNVVAADGATPAATTPNVQVGQAPQEAKQPAKPAEKPKGQQ